MIQTSEARELAQKIREICENYREAIAEREDVVQNFKTVPGEYLDVFLTTIGHKIKDLEADLHETSIDYLKEVEGRAPASDFDFSLE